MILHWIVFCCNVVASVAALVALVLAVDIIRTINKPKKGKEKNVRTDNCGTEGIRKAG
jgi:hypothetical protein